MADKQKPRSEKEIVADLAATRDRLARTVDQLTFRASPAELKRRQVEKLKAKGNEIAFDADGEPRLDRLASALGGVSGVALVLGTARRIFHKR
ncbi:MAG: DUF3618 domain-containing protein [Ornithinimicrobium sp.]